MTAATTTRTEQIADIATLGAGATAEKFAAEFSARAGRCWGEWGPMESGGRMPLLALALGRSSSSVNGRGRRLGLKKPKEWFATCTRRAG